MNHPKWKINVTNVVFDFGSYVLIFFKHISPKSAPQNFQNKLWAFTWAGCQTVLRATLEPKPDLLKMAANVAFLYHFCLFKKNVGMPWHTESMLRYIGIWKHKTRRTIKDVWIRNRQVNRRQRETLFVHLDKRLHFYDIRELWRNFVTYIVINSLYIMCNQVNFCYEWTGCEKGFREPCLFACLLPNKTSSDARRESKFVGDMHSHMSQLGRAAKGAK
jgi:transcription elongation factor GreA-like protein